MANKGIVRLALGVTGISILCFFMLPKPSESAGFWVGCSRGNFRPTDACNRMCRLVGGTMNVNLTSCCYGVNHSSRSACSCCQDITNCPLACEPECFMVQLQTSNCAGDNTPGTIPKRGFPIYENFYDEENLIPIVEPVPPVPVYQNHIQTPNQLYQYQYHHQPEQNVVKENINPYLGKRPQLSSPSSFLPSVLLQQTTILSPYRIDDLETEKDNMKDE